MGRRSTELRRISANEFVSRMKRSVDRPDQRYAFFLGAGCSISSGIPAAGQLVRDEKSHSDWLRQLRDLRSQGTPDHKLNDWARKELSSWNPDSPGSSYGELIERLFLTQGDRQREIERICDEGHFRDEQQKPRKPFPHFGYAVLSSLMCQPDRRFNVALTTNFDDLLSDAFFFFQEVRPLVIHHDSLAPFIRPTDSRPLIVKLHGDHRLSPRNTIGETAALAEIVSQRVSTVLHDRGVIFLGYGGNDESIITMMESLPDEAIPFGLYWVSGNEPRGIFRPWLEARNAVWVEIRDFDELMFRFAQAFRVGDPASDRHEMVLSRFGNTKRQLFVEIAGRPAESIEDATLKTWLANEIGETDIERAEELYEEAIQQFPESAFLLSRFAVFLTRKRKDMKLAEEMHNRAMEADPANSDSVGAFALFVQSVKKDMVRAEELYQRAIELDNNNASSIGNYALFLDDRKDVARAEELYQRAIEADPTHATNLGNYASFLEIRRKDMIRAEDLYRRALKEDPLHSNNLCNYASYLETVKKDKDSAERCYRNAISADTTNAAAIGRFAMFVQHARGDMDRAERLYQRAVRLDPSNADIVGNFANFVCDVRMDLDRAEQLYERAINADPMHSNNLGNYAHFFQMQRKNMDRAEQLYERAIEADPENANCLGNLAYFVQTERKDMERAEKLYQRAIEADPTHANIIGNFAAFVHYERKEMERAEQLYERAIDIGPTEASIICNFAILMETERNDLDRAEKLFTRAIDIAPQRADIIGRFANFLAKARKEAQRAEEMYMRAIGADPTSAINIGNRAGFELSREVSPESLALLRIASGMSNDSDDLALELCFYHFAHGEKKERSLWLAKAKQLIAAGIRSPGWDFGPNIERAIKDGHPTRAWLKKLAAVINGDSPPDVLNTWKAWQQIPSS